MARETRFEAIYHFASEENRQAFIELTRGLLKKNDGEYIRVRTGDPEDELPHHQRRLGKAMLTAFKRPNQSVELEDFQIAAAEYGYFSKSSIETYASQIAREGVIKRLTASWILTETYRNDPTALVRPDVDVDATVNGEPAGLELSEAGCGGCGDQGHVHQDPGHRG